MEFSSSGEDYVCDKKVEVAWSKTDKNFKFKMPSLKWILGDVNVTEELLADARKSPVVVRLNLSKKDPVEMGRFSFVIPPPPPEPEEETNKKDSKKGGKK